MLTGAYQLTEKISLGAGLDYFRAKMGKQKNVLQTGAADADFEMRIKDNFAWGYRLALLYVPNDRHSFGIQYRSPVNLKLRGETYFNGLSGLYAAIFGGSSYTEEASMEAELPQAIIAGYSFKPSDKWVINFDVEWTNWESVEQEYLIYQYETNATRLSVLNNGNPASRDWNNAVTLALGGQYKVNDKLRLRSGFYFKEKAVPQANFEPSLPDAKSYGITAGFGYSFTKNVTLDMGYAFQQYATRKINNNNVSGTIDGTYRSCASIYGTNLRFDF
jgi:long-chain fatty acid transport protein